VCSARSADFHCLLGSDCAHWDDRAHPACHCNYAACTHTRNPALGSWTLQMALDWMFSRSTGLSGRQPEPASSITSLLAPMVPLLAPDQAIQWWTAARPGLCSESGQVRLSSLDPSASLDSCVIWSDLELGNPSARLNGEMALQLQPQAATSCLRRCAKCSRCRFMSWSVSTRTCRFFSQCNLDALQFVYWGRGFTYGDATARDYLSIGVRCPFSSSSLLLPARAQTRRNTRPPALREYDAPSLFEYVGPCASSSRLASWNPLVSVTCNPMFRPWPCKAAAERVRAIDAAEFIARLGGEPFSARQYHPRAPLQRGAPVLRLLFSARKRLVICPIEKAGKGSPPR
jgi:hypothetical protein